MTTFTDGQTPKQSIDIAVKSLADKNAVMDRWIKSVDIGDLRKFTMDEDEVNDVIASLVYCSKCQCIGDSRCGSWGPVNQDDGTSDFVCRNCEPDCKENDERWREDD